MSKRRYIQAKTYPEPDPYQRIAELEAHVSELGRQLANAHISFGHTAAYMQMKHEAEMAELGRLVERMPEAATRLGGWLGSVHLVGWGDNKDWTVQVKDTDNEIMFEECCDTPTEALAALFEGDMPE